MWRKHGSNKEAGLSSCLFSSERTPSGLHAICKFLIFQTNNQFIN